MHTDIKYSFPVIVRYCVHYTAHLHADYYNNKRGTINPKAYSAR